MPVPNLRVVVIGTPKANEEHTLFILDRAAAEKLAEEAAKATGDLEAQIARATRGA